MLGIRTRIRKGDVVEVTAGKERGKQGKVLRVNPEAGRIFVEKLNLIKKHTRPSQANPKGGIIEREAGIHLSNVMLLCGNCGEPTRIAVKILPEGKKIRQCVRCKEFVDKEAR